MYSKKFIIVLIGLMIIFQGCSHTFQGMKKDLKGDWNVLSKFDNWIKKTFW